jgi:xanthine dehydrogenase accessory factor
VPVKEPRSFTSSRGRSSKVDDLYSEIVKSLERKEKVVLATLINRVGSAPRAVGAKYLVKEDGTSFGSIGGGCVEAEVWQGAQEAIRKGEGEVLHFSLTAEQLADGGLICGGDIDIFVELLGEDVLAIYREVEKIKRKGGSGILATLMSINGSPIRGKGAKVLLRESGDKVGTLPPHVASEERLWKEGQTVLQENKPKVIVLGSGNRKAEVLLEPILSEPTVYIFGGGHISQHLSPLAKGVHFKVVVIDDREMFANRKRFPEADEIMVSEFETCFERVKIDSSSYIVIVTRGHLYDGFVLEQAVKTAARYIGMIGSKKKILTLYQNLFEKGISRETLDRVHAPIGLEIHSETPEEIAVSIVAELIKVRGGPAS